MQFDVALHDALEAVLADIRAIDSGWQVRCVVEPLPVRLRLICHTGIQIG